MNMLNKDGEYNRSGLICFLLKQLMNWLDIPLKSQKDLWSG